MRVRAAVPWAFRPAIAGRLAAEYHFEESAMAAAAHLSYPAEGVALIILDNPPRNFGTTDLAMRILEALEAAEKADAKVAVLASDTPGYFLAHWSLQAIVEWQRPAPPVTGYRPRIASLFDAIETMPLVVIAANNGQAWGGGSELSWACDLRIAAESATYGQPEVALGIIPGGGGTTRLARLVGQSRCMELILDGRPISARRAYEMGAVNRVVADDRLREEALSWAAHIARWPSWSLAACKRSLIEGRDLPLPAARRNETQVFRDVARREDSIELMLQAQSKYDGGADSYEAVGFERP
jgi:enoyl-CoA hydratase/carnithine racemase